MAALGKIRKRGVFLIIIIGLGLFAFIAEEGFRSCEGIKNDASQQVGEVLGKRLDYQTFSKMIDEYQEVIKMQQGVQNLNDDQLQQVKEMVWNEFVQTSIIENEAKKLGLRVTDDEMQNILKEGTNPMLLQTPFVNQQTRRFDATALQKFLAERETQEKANPQIAEQYETLYKYWKFIEKMLRQQTLATKYQSLLAHCLLSNPVEAKMAFEDENVQSNIQLAAFPYNAIDDSKVKIEDADLKAKYNEKKELFRQYQESRDIKYIDVQVKASASDRAALQKQFADYATQLAAAADPSEVVRKSTSSVAYLGIPVSKDAFTVDIAGRLDSVAVGQVMGPFENKLDNTLNLLKVYAKQQLPDSVQYREIQVSADTPELAHQKADSIQKALAGGADFEALAKRYQQTGEKIWLTTAQYQSSTSMSKDSKMILEAINTTPVNTVRNITLDEGNIILQVLDRKNMITKYTAAVIKKSIDYSNATRTQIYNKFNSFLSANLKADDLLKNAAKSGYQVQEANDVSTSMSNLVGIKSTKDALKWVFKAKDGEVSPMYECGNNGDNLLVCVLQKTHRVGFRGLDDPQVKEFVKQEVLKDKKAEQIEQKLQGVKSVAEAQKKGAKVTPVNQITFSSPVFVALTGASEPALSGAVAATKAGQFSATPVKGNAGVYVFKVEQRSKRAGKFDAKAQEAQCRQRALQSAGNIMQELYLNAKVVDKRYLF